MKKTAVYIILLVFILSAFGCSANAPTVAPSETPQPTQTPTPAATDEPVSTNDSDDPFTAENIDNMLPIMDSIMLSAEESGLEEHNYKNAENFWVYFYYLCVNHFDSIGGAALDTKNGVLSVPENSILELMYASFSGEPTIPGIPSDMQIVSYNSETKSYEFSMSDRGESYPEIASYEKTDDNKIEVTVDMKFYEDNSVLYSALFTLVENTHDETQKYPLSVESFKFLD